MTISATVTLANMAQANAELEAAGHGPGNFSVPLRTGTAEATHAGLHSWDDDNFLAALQNLSVQVTIRRNVGTRVNFADLAQAELLEWSDPTLWFDNPVMRGDIKTVDGKPWESLVDYNGWKPPVMYREVVAEGERRKWIQPTGAGDAWQLGDEVTHNGKPWLNERKYNTREPGTVDSGWSEILPDNQTPAWRAGGGTGVAGSYNLNDEVTHTNAQDSGNVWTFRSKITANTTEPGTDGTFHRWWEPVEPI